MRWRRLGLAIPKLLVKRWCGCAAAGVLMAVACGEGEERGAAAAGGGAPTEPGERPPTGSAGLAPGWLLPLTSLLPSQQLLLQLQLLQLLLKLLKLPKWLP